MGWVTGLTELRYRSVLCHRKCSGRDNTGQSGHHGTDFDRRALSAGVCGLYEDFREFDKTPDPFFKTTAIDHSANPARRESGWNSRVITA